MQIREGVDHGFADPAACVGLVHEFRRLFIAHDHTMTPFHKVKG